MYLRKFFKAVLEDWVTLMSGLASILLAFIAAFVVGDTTTTQKLLVVVSVVCFIISAYRVWASEHKKNVELEERINKTLVPQLKANLLESACGVIVDSITKQEFSALTFLVEVTNLGGMPSVAKNWKADVFANNLHFKLLPNRMLKFTLTIESGNRVLEDKDYIDDKTFNPITNGGMVRGFLVFFVPVPQKLFNVKGTKVIISFQDSTGKDYEIINDGYPFQVKRGLVDHIPGMEIKPEPPKKEEPVKRKTNKKPRWKKGG
jgi:hypothetical protein